VIKRRVVGREASRLTGEVAVPNDLRKLSDVALKGFMEQAMLDTARIHSGQSDVAAHRKSPVPTEALQPLLHEAYRRGIPPASLAEFVVQRGLEGQSVLGRLLAPPAWREFEMMAASALVQVLRSDGHAPQKCEFDAKVVGRLTARPRQVDLLLTNSSARHLVACEFKNRKGALSISAVEAFASKVRDIGANKGVVVTAGGSQSGAEAAARAHGVALFELRPISSGECQKRSPERSGEIREGAAFSFLTSGELSWVFGGSASDVVPPP